MSTAIWTAKDADLAISAKRKFEQGKTPTQTEQRALRRVEAAFKTEAAANYVRSVPKKDYMAWAGRSRGVVERHAAQFEIPMSGIDVPAIIRWLHDSLDEKQLLDSIAKSSGLNGHTASVADELRLLKARADLEELKRDERVGTLVLRDQVHDLLVQFSNVIRSSGDALGKRFGSEAQLILSEALDDCEDILKKLKSPASDSSGQQSD